MRKELTRIKLHEYLDTLCLLYSFKEGNRVELEYEVQEVEVALKELCEEREF